MPEPESGAPVGTASDSPALQHFLAGLALSDQREWAAAEQAFGRAIEADPARSGPWRNRAECRLELGRVPDALADARELLQRLPDDAAAHALMARALLAAGEVPAAARAFVDAWQRDVSNATYGLLALQAWLAIPGGEEAAISLTVALAERGALEQPVLGAVQASLDLLPDAEAHQQALWQRLLALPAPAEWLWQRAVSHQLAGGRVDGAWHLSERWLRQYPASSLAIEQTVRLLATRGDHQAALPLLVQLLRTGTIATRQRHLEILVRVLADDGRNFVSAGTLCNLLIDQYPDEAYAWMLRGALLLDVFESKRAEADFRQALALAPEDSSTRCKLALAVAQQGRAQEGLDLLDAMGGWDESAHCEVLNTRAVLLRHLGRLDEAVAALRAGLARQYHPALTTNLSYCLLLQGKYREGFALFAERHYTGGTQRYYLEALGRGMQPWRGDIDAARGQRLVLVSQNGVGDAIHSARHAAWLQQQGVQVVVQAPLRTGRLLRSLHPDIEVFEVDEPMPEGDWVADLHDVSALLGVELHTVGNFGPAKCLQADPERVRRMARQLGPRRGLRVALAWRGTRSNLSERSVPLACFAALDLPGVQWLSLQHGPLAPEDLAPARRMNLEHHSWSFDDAAAAMTLADVVVSVDTVHCHLAGSLGLTTLVPLSAVPDWRWGLEGNNTPWYPTMTLLRQGSEGDWSAPMRALDRLLQDLAGQGGCVERVEDLDSAGRWLGQHGLLEAAEDPRYAAHEVLVSHLQARGESAAACMAAAGWLLEFPADLHAARCLVDVAAKSGDARELLLAQTLVAERFGGNSAMAPAMLDCAGHLARLGYADEAVRLSGLVVDATPTVAHRCALIALLLDQQQLQPARAQLEAALAAAPGHPGARLLEAAAFTLEGELEQAQAALESLALQGRLDQSGELAALRIKAQLLASLGRYDEAELAARECYLHLPDATHALLLATQLLAAGEWEEGWRLWRQRDLSSEWKPHLAAAVRAGAEVWTEPGLAALRGRTLLVTSEGGHGDLFQYGRFLPWLAQQGVAVTLLARSQTAALARASLDTVQVLNEAEAWPVGQQHDFVCDVQSLPALLDFRLDASSHDVPAQWLRADAAQNPPRLPPRAPGRLRVGLAWRSQPSGPVQRSLPLQLLADAGIREVDWVSLQFESLTEDEQAAAERLGLLHERWPFAETAAAIQQLDLVISVDTSLAHLAGALGKPCWVLLPQPANWRWGRAGSVTAWYPQARLFRQVRAADWSAPLTHLRAALDDLQVSRADAPPPASV